MSNDQWTEWLEDQLLRKHTGLNCANCNAPMAKPEKGPLPTYCSGRCRMAALRKRRSNDRRGT